MNALRALIIEDNQYILDFLRDYVLEPNGFEVDFAVDGVEGLAKALDTNPDLILLDYKLPKLSGLKVLEELRDQHSQIPVILMTSYGSEQIAVECFRLGVHDYVIKPFDPDEMLDIIERVMRVTYLEREKESLTRQIMRGTQELGYSAEQLDVLGQVGQTITSLKSPVQTLEHIVEAVLSLMKCQACSLILFNAETGQVVGQVRRRYEEHTGEIIRQQSGIRDNQSMLSAQTLTLPLIMGQKVLGNLIVGELISTQAPPDRNDRLLTILTSYAAMAVYNIQLTHQLQRTKARQQKQV